MSFSRRQFVKGGVTAFTFGFAAPQVLCDIAFAQGASSRNLVVVYLSACIAALGAVGLFISTLTEQPIAATIALMIFTILSWILDAVPQLEWLHPWLIVHEWLSFSDLLRDPPFWDNVLRGLGVDAAYAAVFWLLAWARFSGKDVTS